MSYEYVSKAESKDYHSECSRILTQACNKLKKEYEIISRFELVGSGARNMITRNGKDSFDLDYNLLIEKIPDSFGNDLGKFKETIRNVLNEYIKPSSFRDAKDSTSVLTVIRKCSKPSAVSFSFDVAIVKNNKNGTLMRLIHNKKAKGFGPNGQWTWEEVPNSKEIGNNVKRIKTSGTENWNKVRDEYLRLKNLYLHQNDNSHPSFVVYVEAVNLVYNQIFGKGGRNMVKSNCQKVSGRTHSKAELNAYANQHNPNNPVHKANVVNHSNQCNPNNKEYSHSRVAGSKKK